MIDLTVQLKYDAHLNKKLGNLNNLFLHLQEELQVILQYFR